LFWSRNRGNHRFFKFLQCERSAHPHVTGGGRSNARHCPAGAADALLAVAAGMLGLLSRCELTWHEPVIEKLAKQQLAGTSMGSMVLADGTTKKAAPALIIAAAVIFGFLFFSARFSQAVGSWDRDLLLWLKSFAASHWYVWELANNTLFRGFPVFFSLVALWFADDSKERRSRMLAGFLATCVAAALSLRMQFHLATHTRPLLDPAIPLNIAEPLIAGLHGPSLDREHRHLHGGSR